MGMDLSLDTKMITKNEYENLKKGEYLISKYNLEVVNSKDIENEEKAFYLDLFDEIIAIGKISEMKIALSSTKEKTIYNYFKDNWDYLINKYDIDILTPEWLEYTEYITFEEWQNNDFSYGRLYRK